MVIHLFHLSRFWLMVSLKKRTWLIDQKTFPSKTNQPQPTWMSRFDCLETSRIEIILFKFPCDQDKRYCPWDKDNINKQVIVDIHSYLRKERNLLKVAGNDPMIRANTPRTTATIAASTKRSFQLYFINPSYCFSC